MKSKVVIIPVPYEKTTSYGKGTKNGPKAILCAFKQVERYDIELNRPTDNIAIKILPAVKDIKKINYDFSGGNLPIYFGGEHTITAAIIAAIKTSRRDFSILHLDAHSDCAIHTAAQNIHMPVLCAGSGKWAWHLFQ